MNQPARTSSIAHSLSRSRLQSCNIQTNALQDGHSRANQMNDPVSKRASGLGFRATNSHPKNENEDLESSNRRSSFAKPTEKYHNPQEAYEYDKCIYNFMKSEETSELPSANFFDKQTNIRPKMRATVIDWLVEVHKKLKMQSETLYLTIFLMDSYLSKVDLDKSKYQRLSCAALLIAAKSEEIYPPSVNYLVDLTEKSFTSIALNRMEADLFKKVNCHVNPILPNQFLHYFLRVGRASQDVVYLSYFILEASLLDIRFIGEIPSKLAAAAICLSMNIQKAPIFWKPLMENMTGYTLSDLTPIVNNLLQGAYSIQSKTSRFITIGKKYTQILSKYKFPESIQLV